jgi:hypothetical protein
VPRSPGCRPCSASVVRYTRDGRLDRTFGGEGYVDVPLRAATAVRVTGRRILVAGMQDDRFAVERLPLRAASIEASAAMGLLCCRRRAGRG